jgi:hypothetical protein
MDTEMTYEIPPNKLAEIVDKLKKDGINNQKSFEVEDITDEEHELEKKETKNADEIQLLDIPFNSSPKSPKLSSPKNLKVQDSGNKEEEKQEAQKNPKDETCKETPYLMGDYHKTKYREKFEEIRRKKEEAYIDSIMKALKKVDSDEANFSLAILDRYKQLVKDIFGTYVSENRPSRHKNHTVMVFNL